MRELVFNYLKDKKLIKYKESDIAINELKIDDNGNVVLEGNQLGLIMFADYLIEIALSNKESTHIHLDKENFFDVADGELILNKIRNT